MACRPCKARSTLLSHQPRESQEPIAMSCLGVPQKCVFLVLFGLSLSQTTSTSRADELGEKYAAQVTIHRDEWGVPHIDGPTDASCAFGFAYAQAEDYFWQVEDTYIASLGRYAEVYGDKGIDS